jgi:hypothetical protein
LAACERHTSLAHVVIVGLANVTENLITILVGKYQPKQERRQ